MARKDEVQRLLRELREEMRNGGGGRRDRKVYDGLDPGEVLGLDDMRVSRDGKVIVLGEDVGIGDLGIPEDRIIGWSSVEREEGG